MREQESERLRASLAACEQGPRASSSILATRSRSSILAARAERARLSLCSGMPSIGLCSARTCSCTKLVFGRFKVSETPYSKVIVGQADLWGRVSLGLNSPSACLELTPLKTSGVDTDEVTMQPRIAHLIMEQLQELLANQLMEYAARHFCWTN